MQIFQRWFFKIQYRQAIHVSNFKIVFYFRSLFKEFSFYTLTLSLHCLIMGLKMDLSKMRTTPGIKIFKNIFETKGDVWYFIKYSKFPKHILAHSKPTHFPPLTLSADHYTHAYYYQNKNPFKLDRLRFFYISHISSAFPSTSTIFNPLPMVSITQQSYEVVIFQKRLKLPISTAFKRQQIIID